MPGPAGQHTHILQQERATKKVTRAAAAVAAQKGTDEQYGNRPVTGRLTCVKVMRLRAEVWDAGQELVCRRCLRG
jgi:hypothetical protein